MNYYYPIHLDGGNRGCEAIARSTAILVGERPECQFGYCRDVQLDTQLGLARFLTLVPIRLGSYFCDRLLAVANRLCHSRKVNMWRKNYPYKDFLRCITREDRVLFTGGDMLCYGNNEMNTLNDWLHEHGVTTILWGCSMGPENLTAEKRETLARFSLIYARESLTYAFFQSLGLKNLVLLPDPAFILEPEVCKLPACFTGGQVVGINVSSYVMGGMTLQGRFAHEVLQLIDYILRCTALRILLVPHVTWVFKTENQNDCEMAHLITSHFHADDRIHVLDIDRLNYSQIRHVIAHCHAFIGARTHAVISAYSMCVPAIALGYSIKSRGIARDLGLAPQLVVNCKDFESGELLRSFQYLMDDHQSIRQHMNRVVPEYRQRPYEIKSVLVRHFGDSTATGIAASHKVIGFECDKK